MASNGSNANGCENGGAVGDGQCCGGDERSTAKCLARRHVEQGPGVESLRYYLSRRTTLEMLRDRGCAVPDSEIHRSLEDFRSRFGLNPDPDSLRICVPFRSTPHKKILVLYGGKLDITTSACRTMLVQITDKSSLHRVILILQSRINHYAKKELDASSIKFEMFHITDLLVNISKHVTQPKYEILTAEEKQMLVKKYKLEDKKFPQLEERDPIARYYGLEKGQVLKVTHTGGVFEDDFITYRCVT